MNGERIQQHNEENELTDWESLAGCREETKSESEPKAEREHLRVLGEKVLASTWSESPTWANKNQKEIFINNSEKQEKIERALNSTFLSIEELESIMENGAEESTCRTEEYDGSNIPIYNTGNLPFRFLRHSIQYSGGNRSYPLVKDPSLWDRDEMRGRTALEHSFSNMLSMEYLDSIESRNHIGFASENQIAYGFLSFPPRSLSTISTAGQALRKERSNILLDYWRNNYPLEDIPEEIAQRNFMELQAFRYDEDTGKPLFHPDFIIAPTGGVTEDTLKQAAYFGVPVFEIPTKEVKSQAEKQEPDANKQPNSEIERIIEKYLTYYKEEHSLSAEELINFEQRLRALPSLPFDQWSRKERAMYSELRHAVERNTENE